MTKTVLHFGMGLGIVLGSTTGFATPAPIQNVPVQAVETMVVPSPPSSPSPPAPIVKVPEATVAPAPNAAESKLPVVVVKNISTVATPADDIPPVAPGEKFKHVKLTKVVFSMPSGTVFAENTYSIGTNPKVECSQKLPVQIYNGGTTPIAPTQLQTMSGILGEELIKFKMDKNNDEENLFNNNDQSVIDFSLGGIVTHSLMKVCVQNSMIKGTNEYDAEWLLFSNAEQRVVFKTTTHSVQTLNTFTSLTSGNLGLMVFRDTFDQLLRNPEFRKALKGAPSTGELQIKPPANTPAHVVPLVPTTLHRLVPQAQRATVLVKTQDGVGSGFLISATGYVLTAAHVVGDQSDVSIRWQDGLETKGKVIARANGRDVALILTDPHALALPLLRISPKEGTSVYAVGAPLGEKFQSSVTRGIISGVRRIEGYNFLQSDVSVNPGNSGGPLLNDQGAVVGVTVSGFHSATVSGLNMFVPIDDALNFLGIMGK